MQTEPAPYTDPLSFHLVADVKQHGLREPVTLFDGQVLDGRNRLRACVAAGVVYRTREFDGADPVAFVISANLRRRHLTPSQAAMVAAKLANMPHGVRTDRAANLPVVPVTQADAATRLNVSERSVRDAKAVIEHGDPELIGKVERGEVSVSRAAAEVRNKPTLDAVLAETARRAAWRRG